jgi:hypothetical protein
MTRDLHSRIVPVSVPVPVPVPDSDPLSGFQAQGVTPAL